MGCGEKQLAYFANTCQYPHKWSWLDAHTQRCRDGAPGGDPSRGLGAKRTLSKCQRSAARRATPRRKPRGRGGNQIESFLCALLRPILVPVLWIVAISKNLPTRPPPWSPISTMLPPRPFRKRRAIDTNTLANSPWCRGREGFRRHPRRAGAKQVFDFAHAFCLSGPAPAPCRCGRFTRVPRAAPHCAGFDPPPRGSA